MHPKNLRQHINNLKKLSEKLSVVLKDKYFITSAFLFICFMILIFASITLKTYTVKSDENVKTTVTYETNTLNVMEKLGVEVMPGDNLVQTNNTDEGIILNLERSFLVSVSADGGYIYRTVFGGTVGGLLDDLNIQLTDNDFVNLPLDTPLTKDMYIKVSRVEHRIYTEEVAIKHTDNVFPMIFSYTYSRYNPKSKPGKDGFKSIVKKEYIVDGKVEKVETISETVVKKPTTGNVYSDVRNLLNLGGGKPKEKDCVSVITAKATAYTYMRIGGNRTATGNPVGVGVVAVDPKVIPLRSKLYIETADGKFIYGYCKALDTGGAIKGNKVDIFLPSTKDVYNFGVRTVKVYVLK